MSILICEVGAVGFFSLIFQKQINDSVNFSTLQNFFANGSERATGIKSEAL